METWPGLVPEVPRVLPRELEPPVVLRRPEVEDRGCAELVDSPCTGTPSNPQQMLYIVLCCANAAGSASKCTMSAGTGRLMLSICVQTHAFYLRSRMPMRQLICHSVHRHQEQQERAFTASARLQGSKCMDMLAPGGAESRRRWSEAGSLQAAVRYQVSGW